MKPSYDYLYRYLSKHIHNVSGRCRVRIYRRKNGSHIVLLTELDSNLGESVSDAAERIAADLLAVHRLNPKTTRWIQHKPPHGDLPTQFDELHFTRDGAQTASNTAWQRLTHAQAEALIGESFSTLNRPVGDSDPHSNEGSHHEGTETKRSACTTLGRC